MKLLSILLLAPPFELGPSGAGSQAGEKPPRGNGWLPRRKPKPPLVRPRRLGK